MRVVRQSRRGRSLAGRGRLVVPEIKRWLRQQCVLIRFLGERECMLRGCVHVIGTASKSSVEAALRT